jgi:hypothetical protein
MASKPSTIRSISSSTTATPTNESKDGYQATSANEEARLQAAADDFPLLFAQLWSPPKPIIVLERDYLNGTLIFSCQIPQGPREHPSNDTRWLGSKGNGILCVCPTSGFAWRLPLEQRPGFIALHPSLIMKPIKNCLIGHSGASLRHAQHHMNKNQNEPDPLYYRYPDMHADPLIAIELPGRDLCLFPSPFDLFR